MLSIVLCFSILSQFFVFVESFSFWVLYFCFWFHFLFCPFRGSGGWVG